MDDIRVLEECVVKVEEIKEEVCDEAECGGYDKLDNVTVKTEHSEYEIKVKEENGSEEDEVKPTVAIFLQPKDEILGGAEEQEVKTERSEYELKVKEENGSEEDEVKPTIAIFLQPKDEILGGAEEQEDDTAETPNFIGSSRHSGA